MKPILFNTDMVRAILDGRKTVTRRVVKPQPGVGGLKYCYASSRKSDIGEWHGVGRKWNPPYRHGDILYVRETWTHTCIHCKHYPNMFLCLPDCGTCPEFMYKADGVSLEGWPDKRWRPSIHMPREAARIFLRVKGVRVERLQEIKSWQAVEEGAVKRPQYTRRGDLVLRYEYIKKFAKLWDSTIKKSDRALYGWDANPWVWVIEFERISKEETQKWVNSTTHGGAT